MRLDAGGLQLLLQRVRILRAGPGGDRLLQRACVWRAFKFDYGPSGQEVG